MRLAISNIAWSQHDDPKVLALLNEYGVAGIEVAPTKLWPEWHGVSVRKAKQYRSFMADNGFELPAMQAILFGKLSLQLFDRATHAAFLDHIRVVADIANGFGSKVLVFGAPKNRRRNQTPYNEAFEIAAEFFDRAGEICTDRGCCIGLEHNPVEYGCDFVTNVLDAKDLVDRVNNEGFKLHVDSAGLHMCGGDVGGLIRQVRNFVHYHISEPMLAPIIDTKVKHAECIEALKEVDYKGWLSIEMKQPENMGLLAQSLEVVKQLLKA